MATDRSHLSLSLTSTLASGAGSQQPPPPPPPQAHQHTSTSEQTTDNQDASPAPAKRGPGRPKGSTKKSLEADPASPPKIKRPVGRPRKDGRPAGSVPKVVRGPGRPRKNFQMDFAVNTFSQQIQSQHPNAEQHDWPLQGMFNNYRLPKGGVSEPTTQAGAAGPTANKPNGSSATADTNGNSVSQSSKWFPSTTGTSTSNAPAPSSSSIANALIHPQNMGQGGMNNFSDPLVGVSALGLLDRRDHRGGHANGGTLGIGERPPSIPHAQISEFILSTIYSLFSRPSTTTGLPLARDVLSTYRAHLGNLSISPARAYSALKTFWLPYSPVLFRLVFPRTTSSNPVHRNSSTPQQPSSSSSLNSNFPSQPNQPAVNGDSHNANRTPLGGEQNYGPHRFFFWDPFHLSLGGPLNCPVCHQAPLSHLGPIRTGPLRVFDLPSGCAPSASAHTNAGLVPAAFYVIGMQYGCPQQTCGMKFNSWDSRIVNNLPQVLADEWPVHLSSVMESEQSENRGWSGDAVTRPLFTLTKTLVQIGTPRVGVRDVLAKLWNWSDSEKEEQEDEGSSGGAVNANTSANDQDKVAVVEALFSNPYDRLWPTPQAVQSHDADGSGSGSASMVNGQRPAKRQKTSDVPQSLSSIVPATATAPAYLSRTYAPQSSTAGDSGSSGVTLQVQDHHRVSSSSVDNHRSPRLLPHPQGPSQSQSQSQSKPQSQPQVRHQPSGSQLKPNTSTRPPLPSPRTTISHNRAPPHIHTPSPIYPSTSLPNSNTNSPQTGSGTQLSLKRPLEADSHHPGNAGGSSSVPAAPAPAPTQSSPGQPHFPGIVHNSPYSHLRPLQQQQHPPHPSQQQHHHHHQQASLASHHQPSAPTRPGPPLHLHHPSLNLGSNSLRFGPTTLQPHQSLLGNPQRPPPPHAPPPHAPQGAPQAPPASQHTPQRRVRHCVKCGRHDCKGKGGSQFCKNNCKDCGGMDCRGRNSKRPNATCREGW